MGLLKKKKKKKPLKIRGGGGGGGISSKRPLQVEKLAPCIGNCPSGNDIRQWIEIIAQREKTGVDEEEAFDRAWNLVASTNPFPATMGRVCPHPCEDNCNRNAKDGAVAINTLERFIGDWGIDRKLPLPKLDAEKKSESIGVIGAGPAGLSFAYQMASRGYPVTVYEAYPKAGGMLYYGIPFYRLPEETLGAEIQKIIDAGVEIKLSCVVGKDIPYEEVRSKHQVLFLGIGAHQGKPMRIPGEEGSGVWKGTDYLREVNRGEDVDVGMTVAIIGGGDTAVDAARMARRAGAEVTIVYRRTRTEMPAIDSEIEDAFKEDVKIEFLLAPVEIKRNDDGSVKALTVRKMELGEPDSSGRRRPVPIDGSDYDIPVDTVIAAISQQADWGPLPELKPEKWLKPDRDRWGKLDDTLLTGGDAVDLGIATTAIGHGRQAAEVIHAQLRGIDPPKTDERPNVTPENLKLDFYDAKDKVKNSHRPVEEWLSKPDEEIVANISKDQFLAEIDRCFSCGLCFGCERCWMYCTPSCFIKVDEEQKAPGNYYTIKLDVCDGCTKCADECPCGFLAMV